MTEIGFTLVCGSFTVALCWYMWVAIKYAIKDHNLGLGLVVVLAFVALLGLALIIGGELA